jgi:predicted ArsR family transcriptional regulator
VAAEIIASDRSRDRVLYLLKMRGGQATAALARALQMSVPGVRVHLDALAAAGLVNATPERRGVGRPGLRWSVTAAAQAEFPDTHGALTVEVITAIREALGPAALARVIAHRDDVLRRRYGAAIGNSARLDVRVKRLARLRSEEGYMAEVQRDGKDWLLIENHCPICAAAAACQGLCASELTLLQDVLGADALVERTEYLLAGARRCAYRVSRRAAADR